MSLRILYYSDLHLEILANETLATDEWMEEVDWPLGAGPDLRPYVGLVDLVVLAGDIGRARAGSDADVLRYCRAVASFLGCEVILVPGNHEYYRGVFDTWRAQLMAYRDPDVRVLDRDQVVIEFGGVRLRVLGCTLFTDYEARGNPTEAMEYCREKINDHKAIRTAGGRSPFLPKDARVEHRRSTAWLEEALADPFQGSTLLVFHHVPSLQCEHPEFIGDPLLSAFNSDLDDLIAHSRKDGVVACIYGHNHWNPGIIEVGGVPLLTAQVGYRGENTNWTGPGVLTVHEDGSISHGLPAEDEYE